MINYLQMSDKYNLTNSFLENSVFAVLAIVFFCNLTIYAQQVDSAVVVQPGAPGEATKVLPSTTTAKLPPVTKADVEFMQGMIHHHAQAVEMVALMNDRTKNAKLLSFGARISQTQSEEIKFMERWLRMRGQKTSMEMSMNGKMNMPMKDGMKVGEMKKQDHSNHQMLMPGMLTSKQMKQLAAAKGKDFDRLFLTGMIQHHEGALVMVDELFNASASGQEATIFTFATDVDSTQRAEIRLMNLMLEGK